MFDYSKLKGRIVEKFDTQQNFEKYLKKGNGYVTRYLTGQSEFSQSTIILWCEALDIDTFEIADYFFCRLETINA